MRLVEALLFIWLAALVGAVAAAPAPRAGGGTHNPQPAPTSCPTVTVSCYDTATYGAPIRFTANISAGDPAVTPTFKWAAPGFRILSGQATSAIAVEPPARGGSVVATVEIGGYDRSCTMKADCTSHIIYDPGPSKIDEYGDIAVGDEKRRLDIFNEELLKDPMAQGYLLCYGGRRSRANEAQRRCDRAKYFLVNSRGIEAQRLVAVDGGFREKPAIELWLVPSGAVPPLNTPTVDPKDVRPPRPPRKAPPRGRR